MGQVIARSASLVLVVGVFGMMAPQPIHAQNYNQERQWQAPFQDRGRDDDRRDRYEGRDRYDDRRDRDEGRDRYDGRRDRDQGRDRYDDQRDRNRDGRRGERDYDRRDSPRGSVCVTSRGSCPTGVTMPPNTPCQCDLPGFGKKRGAVAR